MIAVLCYNTKMLEQEFTQLPEVFARLPILERDPLPHLKKREIIEGVASFMSKLTNGDGDYLDMHHHNAVLVAEGIIHDGSATEGIKNFCLHSRNVEFVFDKQSSDDFDIDTYKPEDEWPKITTNFTDKVEERGYHVFMTFLHLACALQRNSAHGRKMDSYEDITERLLYESDVIRENASLRLSKQQVDFLRFIQEHASAGDFDVLAHAIGEYVRKHTREFLEDYGTDLEGVDAQPTVLRFTGGMYKAFGETLVLIGTIDEEEEEE